MQAKPITMLELLTVPLVILWLPFALLIGIFYRFVETRDTPLGIDLLLAVFRATAKLPLSIKRRSVGLLNVERILASSRFRSSKQDLCQRIDRDGFSGYWVCQGSIDREASLADCDLVIFWIHGGAYVLGSPLMSLIQFLRITEILQAKGVNVGIFSLEYGLAPEHTFPRPFEQGLAAYKYVSSRIDPRKLVMCGESAGGHLVLTLLDQLAQKGIPKPLGATLLYPWVDLSNSGHSVVRNQRNDMLVARDLNRAVKWACGNAGAAAFADILDFSTPRPRGHWRDVLPTKTWVGVGSHDLFVDSIQDFVNHAHDDGSDIVLDIWPGKTHGHPAIMDALSRRRYLQLDPEDDVGQIMQGSQIIANAILDILSARSRAT